VKNKNDIVVDDELIARYLSGEAQPEEAEALIDWLEEPFNLAHFEKIQATWDVTFPSKGNISFDKDSAWDSLQHNIQSPSERSSWRLWFKIAATLIIGLSAALVSYRLFQSDSAHSEITVVTLKNTETVTLPDNSTVVVNRNSTISYLEDFGNASREVNFSGEGFFSVKGDESMPFIVHTPFGHIRVIGTVFNVSSTPGGLEVNVQEGKVLVYTPTDSAYLTGGQSASLGAGKLVNIVNSIDANQWGYATRKFDFQDVPLANVFESIEKAYPYTIEVANKDIKNCRLTASFDHVSAREMLNLIGETLDLTIQENDSTFRVEGKGCPWVQ
jgi:ferric-dicitrate binding protein FerR (iron transport regulator)